MKKALLIALSAFTISQPASADIYPGDAEFENIRKEVYGGTVRGRFFPGITGDQIRMTTAPDITTRNDLCKRLVSRHNSHTVTYNERDVPTGRRLTTPTNANFIGVRLVEMDCLEALWSSQGYSSPAGWRAWAGDLSGTWFNDTPFINKEGKRQQIITDPAVWLSPVKERGTGSDTRNYDLQSVVFSARKGGARYGWNMSHPDVAYVWGWDGKDNNDKGGRVGMHVGFTFEKSGAQCIIWATTEEAFLECVRPSGSTRKRTSTGFFGIGQWTIR